MHIILFMLFVVGVSFAHDLMGNLGIIIFIGILIYLIFVGRKKVENRSPKTVRQST